MKHIKPTKEQKEWFRFFWKQLQSLEDIYSESVDKIEKDMAKMTKIKGAEFFRGCDGYYSGIGNSPRTMHLIQQEELERTK